MITRFFSLFAVLTAVAVGAIAWFLADVNEGLPTIVVGMVLALLTAVGGVVALVSTSDEGLTERGRRRYQRAALLLAVCCAAWWTAGLLGRHPGTTVYLDNQSDQDVVLRLDGRPWADVDHKATAEARMAFGTHTIVTLSRADARELDRQEVEAKQVPDLHSKTDDSCPYIFNVLGAAAYKQGTATYGNMSANDSETDLRDRWILADVDWVLQSPSSAINVAAGQDYAIVKYIRRADPQ